MARPRVHEPEPKTPLTLRALRMLRRMVLWALALIVGLVLLFSIINPPTTHTILTDPAATHDRDWVALADIAPVMARSVVAAEDANFCAHWGFDMAEIRKVIASGSSRGASTLTQQVAKNVFLWQDRSWPRKALEAGLTPLIEATWSKRRILEVYLNVAEFGPGIYGIDVAARELFGTTPDRLSAVQAARLAAVLPNPKDRNAARPDASLRRRAAQILDGAATIAADGRDRCFRPLGN
ncbi:monofunctional biosynthetic peptidoglycan transglycosylase [Paracoccus sp. p4-l81]|uniref:monofunctional biosynthetic peptidoglycan transglycosylase n=1 Tax=Paracoccus sp. p4-l81 TaxID=3342806 RepID=UPI0035B916E2